MKERDGDSASWTQKNPNDIQTITSFEVPGWAQFDLSNEVKTQTTQTLQGEPRPSFGPRRLSRGQGHWRNSRKNVVQALLLIPASPANLIYNMNSWISHTNTHTHSLCKTDCQDATRSSKLLTTPWPGPHQDNTLAKRGNAQSVKGDWSV